MGERRDRGMEKQKKFWKKLIEDRSGMVTIEATIVFPALFFSLILILFMGLVLYQEVNLQSLAVRASERGAVVYGSRTGNMTTSIKTLDDFKYRDPYRNVPFLNTLSDGSYRGLIEQYVGSYIGDNNVLEGENPGHSVEIENYIIAKRVKVRISNGYQIPVESIGKMFGHEGPFEVNTAAVSAVTDSPDFVRNVDLALDVVQQSKLTGGAFQAVSDGFGKIKDALGDLAEFLK